MPERAVIRPMLFGKLRAHGDFVARGMTAAERAWWDERLSIGIARARAACGPAFDATCEVSSPWRFRLRPGPMSISGAVAASIDRAGRRFPLIVARRDADGAAACEAALRDGLSNALDADALIARVAPSGDPVPPPVTIGWWHPDRPGDPVIEADPAAALPIIFAFVLAGETARTEETP